MREARPLGYDVRMRQFRRGDVVEVRGAAEILETLDDSGALDGIPFMPEMLRHVGRRFTISTPVEKICDTITATGSRRMHDVVFLEDLRCDGSGHGGCQAGCRIYWKEAWLRPATNVDNAAEVPVASPDVATAASISACARQRARPGTSTVTTKKCGAAKRRTRSRQQSR